MIRTCLLLLLACAASLVAAEKRPAAKDVALTPVPAKEGSVYIDVAGKVVLPGPYREAEPFSEGLAAVVLTTEDGATTRGYIDARGGFVITLPKGITAAGPFSGGLAAVKGDGGYGFIDRAGAQAIPCTLKHPGTFVGDVCVIEDRQTGTASLLDRKGRLTDLTHAGVGRFANGLAPFRATRPGPMGYLSADGTIAIPATFAEAEPFSEGLAWVAKDDGLLGAIDAKGTMKIKPQFAEARPFSGGLAVVCIVDTEATGLGNEATWAAVNPTGKIVFKAAVHSLDAFSEGLATFNPAADPDRWGFYDATGKVAIPPRFDSAEPFSNGLAKVVLKDEEQWIDRKGKVVWRAGVR